MSTGGIALLLASQPHTFPGLLTIGKIVYIWDLVLFVVLTIAIAQRFIRDPSALAKSLTHPSEALFFGTFWLSIPTIIANMQKYGVASVGSWLPVVIRVLFWIYLACTILVAIFQYFYLFTARKLTAHSMTPAWLLPLFPAMLSGTVAAVIAASQPPDQRMPILVAGCAFQGFGIMTAMLFYSILIARLMEFGLPAPDMRPGMFIAVGPPAFTGLALIGMANAVPTGYSISIQYPMAPQILAVMATFIAVFLWALSFWFFAIAVISVLAGARQMSFHLVWWGMVFPNVGFTSATISIGNQLRSPGILWVGSVMTIVVVAMYLFVLCAQAWALLTQRMMMPGLDEDKDEEDRK